MAAIHVCVVDAACSTIDSAMPRGCGNFSRLLTPERRACSPLTQVMACMGHMIDAPASQRVTLGAFDDRPAEVVYVGPKGLYMGVSEN